MICILEYLTLVFDKTRINGQSFLMVKLGFDHNLLDIRTKPAGILLAAVRDKLLGSTDTTIPLR